MNSCYGISRHVSLAIIILATSGAISVTADEAMKLQSEITIPRAACFDLEGIGEGRYDLVGRLSLKRQFMGSRATPAYVDKVKFDCFSGERVEFSSFMDPQLEQRLAKLLVNGRSLPAIVSVRFEYKRMGHDGINQSERLVAQIESCDTLQIEAVSAAADVAGFDAADTARFKASLDPDFENAGVAISLGQVNVRSKVTPRGSGFSIYGIRVFNATSEAVTIEIVGVTIEQEGVRQTRLLKEQSSAPRSWQVESSTWADGLYEIGKMPGVLWMFDYTKPIVRGKKVKVQVELKMDGGESVVLKREVDPS